MKFYAVSCYKLGNRMDEAKEICKKAIILNPNDKELRTIYDSI